MADEVNYGIERPGDLPDGILDSAALFFAGIREKAAMDPNLVEDAIKFLEKDMVETMRKIDHDWERNGRRYRMAFFTGAWLGARISWARFKMYLSAKDWEAKRKIAEGKVDEPV
jgi:hypothetical protein